MVDYVVQGGSSGGYRGGTQVVGRAPAMLTGGSVTPKPLFNYLKWDMPTDAALANIGIFRAPKATTPIFPGGSPLYVIGRDNHYKDQDPQTVIQDFDYWGVSYDINGNPNPIAAANAAYLGHS